MYEFTPFYFINICHLYPYKNQVVLLSLIVILYFIFTILKKLAGYAKKFVCTAW